jgi:hypothetical protein
MGQINQAIKVSDVFQTFAIKNFVETGTGVGESLDHVISITDDVNIHTIELMDVLHQELTKKYGSLDRVNLIKGYSHEEIAKLIPNLDDGPTLFWHDAHFPGADFHIDGATYTSEKDPVKRIPLESELRAVASSGRDISKDIFVIDDLRVYKDGPYQEGNWQYREVAGADNIDFVYELFDETHYIIESYVAQGFLILFPINTDVETCKELIVGIVE